MALKTLLHKQFRLFLFWGYFVVYVAINTAIVADFTIHEQNTNQLVEKMQGFIACSFIRGDSDLCNLRDYIDYPGYEIIIAFHIVSGLFPIVTFILFGFRESLFQYWKEYFLHVMKHKSFPLQFTGSMDPNSKYSSDSGSVEDPKYTKAMAVRNSIREL